MLNQKRIKNNNIIIQDIVRHLMNDFYFGKIISSDAFIRLKDISFLGAIDHSETQYILSKEKRTRYEHSLYVAALAFYISKKRKYKEDNIKNIVAAALLHDIGHLPLSHSAEPSIKKKFGIGHHELGEKIICGEIKSIKNINMVLERYFDTNYILYLLNTRNKNKDDGSDLFSSKINIDTIDGIIRCLEYKNLNSINSLNRINIAESSFIYDEEPNIGVLDNFWKTKDFVYKNMINNNFGIIPDKISEFYFIEHEIKEEMLFSCEIKWKRKFKELFFRLRNNEMKDGLINKEIKITARDYFIKQKERNILERYLNTKKTETRMAISNNIIKNEQLDLFKTGGAK